MDAETTTNEAISLNPPVVQLASSSNGRVSGKSWKPAKTATKRSFMQVGVKAKSWESRMLQTTKELAVNKLQNEMKHEKDAELARRREISTERRKAKEEKERLEILAAKMSAKKAERMRRRAGRSKKVRG